MCQKVAKEDLVAIEMLTLRTSCSNTSKEDMMQTGTKGGWRLLLFVNKEHSHFRTEEYELNFSSTGSLNMLIEICIKPFLIPRNTSLCQDGDDITQKNK